MLPPQTVLDYAKAQPFRPFRIHLARGRGFDIRDPGLIKVLRNYLLIFKATGDNPDVPDEHESVSLMLTESISHLESPVH